MRPLVVLLLVLGALGALLYALTSIAGTGRRGGADAPIEVRRSESPEPAANLVEPVLPAVPAQSRKPEDARETVVEGPQSGPVELGAIEGLVVDEQAQPIAEAHISLLNTRPSEFDDVILSMRNIDPPRPVAKIETDEQGVFRFDRLDPRKQWTLVVSHERYMGDKFGPIAVPENGVWTEKIILKMGQSCSGMIRDALSGQPIGGATLVVENPLAPIGRKKSATRIEAKSDANGAYAFLNVRPGQNTLTVSAPGYATQVHNNFSLVNLAETTRFKNRQAPAHMESKEQDFDLQPGKVIAGQVVGPDRAGVPNIEIEALNQSGTIGSRGFAVSTKNGEFLIEGLAEGVYTVRVTAVGFDAAPAQRVEAGETNLVITLFEQASVTGKVIDSSGRPLTSFTIKVRTANELSQAFGAVVAQKAFKDAREGAFELGGVPEGAHVIEAIALGYASSFSPPFDAVQGLVSGDVVVRMTQGGTLSGRVIDSYGGAPLAGIDVSTRDNNWIDGDFFELFSALEPSALTKASVRTDAEGRFELTLMTPGDYQVQILGKGYSPIFVNDVHVIDGQSTRLPDVTLAKGAQITGIVRGRDGEISPGSTVQLTPVDQTQTNGHRTARSDAQGRYLIENAQPGTYQLSAMRPNLAGSNPFETIGDMRQSQIEISIEDGGTYDFDLHMAGARGN